VKYIIWTTLLTTFAAGCGSRTFTNTERAAIEQLLLSGAVDNALEKLDIPQLAGKKTYLDFTNLKSYDIEYVKAAVRARFAEIGAHLTEDTEQAEYVAEISSGALGTEYKSSILGIPSIPIPNSSVHSPELALARGVEQTGIAKLLVLVHSNGELVSTGHYYGKVERDESFVLFFHFEPKDDIRTRWEAADEKVKAKSTQHAD
jgi:hypothetical protein